MTNPFVVFHLSPEEKKEAVEKLISRSSPRQEFFLMIVLSVLMATAGLLIGNEVVIIGSMLVAPLLSPVLSLALGFAISDYTLIGRSGLVLVKSSILAILASMVVTAFFNPTELPPEVFLRTMPSLVFMTIAIVAGLAGSFASIRPNLVEMLPGVAISVALIPPIAVTGIGIARLDWALISGSLLLYFVNIVGIIFSALLVFQLTDFYGTRGEAERVIKKEEKAIAKEEKRPPQTS